MIAGLNEKNEQTVTQQQSLATSDTDGTRDGDDGHPVAGDTGSDEGKEPKGDERKDVDSRSEVTGSPRVGMQTRSEQKGPEVLGGEAEPESNVSNMPGASPVAGRTRGKRRPNTAREDKSHKNNSNTDVRAEVDREAEVSTASDQPRKGRLPGSRRRKRLPREDSWSLRVGI